MLKNSFSFVGLLDDWNHVNWWKRIKKLLFNGDAWWRIWHFRSWAYMGR